MINIWEYEKKHVIITCDDGAIYQGYAFDIIDAEEDEDEIDDSIVLDLDGGGIIGFCPSEIQDIKIVEE